MKTLDYVIIFFLIGFLLGGVNYTLSTGLKAEAVNQCRVQFLSNPEVTHEEKGGIKVLGSATNVKEFCEVWLK